MLVSGLELLCLSALLLTVPLRPFIFRFMYFRIVIRKSPILFPTFTTVFELLQIKCL